MTPHRRHILPLLALLFWAGTAQAHSDAEYRLLAEIICAWETRGEAEPDQAIGDAGELGRCQVKPTTARLLGVRFAALENPEASIQTAVAVLRWCASKGWHGTYNGAHCYNAGPKARLGSAHAYARQIASDYAKTWLKWRTEIRLAEEV